MIRVIRPVVGMSVVVTGLAGLAVSLCGTAAADTDVTGQKYSDAQSSLSGAGLKPVVETVVGDQKSWPDCVVTHAQKRTVQPPPNSSGSATNEMLVSLNCEAGVATATTPGNSAASPEGRAAEAAAASSSGSGS
jgi:hypothetical protein